MTFDNLGLHPKVLKAVALVGYAEATQIQLKAIPKISRGFDLRASAQTGTGKTAAFLLPALSRIANPSKVKKPRLLVLAPTRELAMQIAKQSEKYSGELNHIKTVCLYGGAPFHIQARHLSRRHDVVIATPGRLLDFMHRGKVDLSAVEMLILDEADRMLDMGFAEAVEEIIAATPPTRQTLLFSATLKGEVIKLSERFLTKPQEIVVHAQKERHDHIEQRIHQVGGIRDKNRLLSRILDQEGIGNTIVFTATKQSADQLAEELKEKGYQAMALHGDMRQRERTRTIDRLRKGEVRVLVATDVAARGIDVDSISHVVNFDLPRNAEDYVHRIGRTGRAGASGTALSFAGPKDHGLLKKIERYTGHKIDIVPQEGQKRRAGRPPQPHRKGRPSAHQKRFHKSRRP